MEPTDTRYVGLAFTRAWRTHLQRTGPSDRDAFWTTRQEMDFVQNLERELSRLGYKITKE